MTTVIITSVLNPSNKPLDYTPVRSVYSPSERVDQSIDTILSVRKNLGDVRIVFVDCSVVLPEAVEKIRDVLHDDDEFVDLSEQTEVSSFVNSANKGRGELMLLNWAIDNFSFEGDIFKISGRYYLDDNFDFTCLDRSADVNCRARGYAHANNVCHTAFYRMRTKDIFKRYITHGKEVFATHASISAEHVLYDFLAANSGLKVQNLGRIGSVGNVAVNGFLDRN